MLQYLQILLAGHRARMDERGASAVEYGLLVGGIAAVIAAMVYFLGENVQELFTDSCTSVSSNANTTADCA